jgi:hypothetical protein
MSGKWGTWALVNETTEDRTEILRRRIAAYRYASCSVHLASAEALERRLTPTAFSGRRCELVERTAAAFHGAASDLF